MKTLNELERSEQILTAKDMREMIHPIDKLPTASESLLGQIYILSTHQEGGYIAGKTYQCVKDGSRYIWKMVNYYEAEPTAPCTNIWATSVRDPSTSKATIFIHWTDPEDTDTAHWDHSVIVKKKGNIPMNIHDGEIVGYSSIRNQYSKKNGFIDSIDIDCVDDNDILEDLEIEITSEYVPTTDEHRNINKQYFVTDGTGYREAAAGDFDDEGDFAPELTYYEDPNRYYYNIFSVSKFGIWIAGNGCGSSLSWKKFQELVQNGVGKYALDIGDIVQVRHDGLVISHDDLDPTIDFQVVAYDNNIPEGKSHSVTFMACDVLFRGSFDHKELEFAVTQDETWDPYKAYYTKSGSEYTVISSGIRLMNLLKDYNTTTNPVYERSWNTSTHSASNNPSIYGRNTWKDSNARQWLNSDQEEWFEPQHKFDTYSDDFGIDGAYGISEFKFPGFRYGLEENLLEVMAKVKVKTTVPIWARDASSVGNPIEETEDWVFLPAYTELFGHDETFPADVSDLEGKQFDIYTLGITNTRMKTVLRKFNTTTTGEKDIRDNLASWWMRTPTRTKQRDPGPNTSSETTIDCVEIVTNEERRYDIRHELGEDGGVGRQPYVPAPENGNSDIPRDVRKDSWNPVGTSSIFVNNTTPGFVPCFVIA